MLLIPFNLFSWSVTSEKKVPKEVCLDLLKQTPKFTNIHVVVSLRLQSYSHIVPTIFPRPILRTFPGLRLIFQSSKIHINPRSQLSIYLSDNQKSFSRPFQSWKIPQHSRIFLIFQDLYKPCLYFLLWKTGWTIDTSLIYFELNINLFFPWDPYSFAGPVQTLSILLAFNWTTGWTIDTNLIYFELNIKLFFHEILIPLQCLNFTLAKWE